MARERGRRRRRRARARGGLRRSGENAIAMAMFEDEAEKRLGFD
jgi:hypothetical protein